MKKLFILFLATFALCQLGYSATPNAEIAEESSSYCNWKAWYSYPKENQRYDYGKPVYVKLDIKNYRDIKYVECYVNGKFIRKETNHPYEWCTRGNNGDQYLRKLPKGKHKITCKVYDKCGKWKEFHRWVVIGHGGGGGYPDDDGPVYCDYTCKYQYPYNEQHYDYGKPVYVKLDIKNYQESEVRGVLR